MTPQRRSSTASTERQRRPCFKTTLSLRLLCVSVPLCSLCRDLLPRAAAQHQAPDRRRRPRGEDGRGHRQVPDRELAGVAEERASSGSPTRSSPEAYAKSVQPNRERLKKILGVVDKRVPVAMEYVGRPGQPSLVARDELLQGVRGPLAGAAGRGRRGAAAGAEGQAGRGPWSRFPTPTRRRRSSSASRRACNESQFARRLAENGCRVLVPVADRPRGHLLRQPEARPRDQPAAPRVRLSHGLRDGPAHHRLRGAEGAGRGGLVRSREDKAPAGRRVRLRRRRADRACTRRRSTTRIEAAARQRLLRPARGDCGGADLPQRLGAAARVRRRGTWRADRPARWSVEVVAQRASAIGPRPAGRREAETREARPAAPRRDGRARHAGCSGRTSRRAAARCSAQVDIDRAGRSAAGLDDAATRFLEALWAIDARARTAWTARRDCRQDFDPAARAEAPVRPARRVHAEAVARLARRRARTFWAKADASSPETWEKSCDWYREYFRDGGHRQAARPDDAAQPAHRARSTTSRSGRATRWCSTSIPTCSPTASCWCRRT